jgi:hypothetical protein
MLSFQPGGEFLPWNISRNIIREIEKTTMNWGMKHAQPDEIIRES